MIFGFMCFLVQNDKGAKQARGVNPERQHTGRR